LTLTDEPLNLIGMEMIDELENLLENIPQYNLRAMLVQAEGDMFSAGVNVEDVFK
jgi:enoyl-CoA hydratase/carnithine racemase